MSIDFFIELDRQLLLFLNGSNSLFVDGIMLTYTSTLTWIPLFAGLIYLIIKNNETMLQIFLIIFATLLCFGVSDLITDGIVKPLVVRPRPCSDPFLKYVVDVVDNYRMTDYSFFSAHASNTMSIALFLSLLVKDKLFSVAMIGWSLLNCYTRLYLAMHYPSDIFVGLLCGVGVGMLMYYLFSLVMRKIYARPRFISTHYTKSGYSTSDIDVVLLLIVVSLLYGVIRATLMSV